MAWNEPSGGKDPWSGKNKQQVSPDIDKLFKDFQKRVSGILGNRGGGNFPPSGDGITMLWVGLVAVIVVAIWFVSGLFIVRPAEEAVVLRFGQFSSQLKPGLHWIPQLIDQKYIVNVEQIDAYKYDANMLTKDENIVSVEVVVQYRRANPKEYLFNVVLPVRSLQQATASALRQTIGEMDLEPILTAGRVEIEDKVKRQVSNLMDRYGTGLAVTDVALQLAKPPTPVEASFNDVIKAREDKERFQAQAEAYRSQVIPQAEGNAKRLLESAQGYQQKVVQNSLGETSRFTALLPEYQRAPQVTRERLYLSAMESVLSNSTKVFIDMKQGNNLVYLPLDKILEESKKQPKIIRAPLNTDTENHEEPTTVTNTRNSQSGYLSFADRDQYQGRGR